MERMYIKKILKELCKLEGYKLPLEGEYTLYLYYLMVRW